MRHRCLPVGELENDPTLLDIICGVFPDEVFEGKEDEVSCSFCILTCGLSEGTASRRGEFFGTRSGGQRWRRGASWAGL